MAIIYYEAGLPATLVPVQFIGWAKTPEHDLTGGINVVVKLKRSVGTYCKGETLHLPNWSIVEKAGVRGGFQRVRPAALPSPDPSKLLPARV